MDFVTGEILAVDKPLGWTSFDVVKRIRGAIQRRLHVKKFKVGHAGTLDPLASGVLLICTGRATRNIETLQAGRKEYVATIRLGASTPSFDLETEIDRTMPCGHVTIDAIRDVLPDFTGHIMQVPPVFSAVKIDGKRAYSLARRGKQPELKAKPLQIDELELIKADLPEFTVRVLCSKGTYIRALARDLGEALGTCAHLTSLRRSRVGDFGLNDIRSVDDTVALIADCPLEFPDNYQSPDNVLGQS